MALSTSSRMGFDRTMATRESNQPNHDHTDDGVPEPYATVAESLTVHGDLSGTEVEALIGHWSKLDARLRSFEPGAVRLDLHLKDRDRPGQHLTLEATIDHWPVLVATSSDARLDHALNVVRDEMIRLISDARDRQRPRRRG
jgi:hypothetical protein